MEDNIKDFLSDYGELVKKHKVDFISYPVFVPSEKGEFKVMVQTRPVSTEQRKTLDEFIAK